jgi:hypothetical protein
MQPEKNINEKKMACSVEEKIYSVGWKKNASHPRTLICERERGA